MKANNTNCMTSFSVTVMGLVRGWGNVEKDTSVVRFQLPCFSLDGKVDQHITSGRLYQRSQVHQRDVRDGYDAAGGHPRPVRRASSDECAKLQTPHFELSMASINLRV